MYIITARRMISGDVLKYRNGLAFIPPAYEAKSAASKTIPLTMYGATIRVRAARQSR